MASMIQVTTQTGNKLYVVVCSLTRNGRITQFSTTDNKRDATNYLAYDDMHKRIAAINNEFGLDADIVSYNRR